jgi:hypothetical protein
MVERIQRLTCVEQLDITDDGFLSLMNDNGDTKDDVKVPDGEVGDKINKLFKEDEKDTSESPWEKVTLELFTDLSSQTLSFSPPWVRRLPSTPRRLLRELKCTHDTTPI